jgi:iron transport multicopper oxidase
VRSLVYYLCRQPEHVLLSAATILTLSDWYHTMAMEIGLISYADSTLINGLGRYPGGPSSPLAVVTVTKGKR